MDAEPAGAEGRVMSVLSILKPIANFEQNIMKVVKEGVDLLTHDHTPADVERWEQHVRDVCKDGNQSLDDEAQKQMQEHASNHLMDKGFSKAQADAWAESTLKKVSDLNDSVRKSLPAVKQTGRFFVVKAAALLALGGWALTAITGIHAPESDAEMAYHQMQQASDERAREQDQIAHLTISGDDFNILMGGLQAHTAPSPQADTPPVAAAAAPLPLTVAAEAADPVDVKVTTPTGTREFTTTVGEVYRNSPPAVQQVIEQPVTPIDHGYDHEDPNDCFHTHCLGSDGGNHKTFTVDGTPFGSATFQY
jgi:hypothetical protein